MNSYVLATDKLPQRSFAIPQLPAGEPLRWLKRGIDDLRAAPVTGLVYGAVVAALAFLLVSLTVGVNRFYFVPFIFGGFLILSPLLSVGLMAMAKRREDHDAKPSDTVRRILAANMPGLSLLGLFLLLVFANWIMLSNLVFGGVFHELMPTYGQVRPLPVLFGESWPFALIFGGTALIVALLVFRVAALSLPMLIDQRVDAVNAALASWRAVGENWPAMLLWAALIAVLVTAGIMTYYIGLVVVTPLLGFASWHAYRATLIPEPKDPGSADTRV